jgi:hypothetical protein
MSDARFRTLERELKTEPGKLEAFLEEQARKVEDPELVARLVNLLSYKLTAPAGNLLVLSTQERIHVGVGETHTYPIMVPSFEGRRGKILCFRYVWTTTGMLSWAFAGPGVPGAFTPEMVPEGKYSVPMAEDPFELQQATSLNLEVRNDDGKPIDATFTLWCRHVVCEKCGGDRYVDFADSGLPATAALFGDLGAPCPECCPDQLEEWQRSAQLSLDDPASIPRATATTSSTISSTGRGPRTGRQATRCQRCATPAGRGGRCEQQARQAPDPLRGPGHDGAQGEGPAVDRVRG